jgi:hypothetical protein
LSASAAGSVPLEELERDLRRRRTGLCSNSLVRGKRAEAMGWGENSSTLSETPAEFWKLPDL